MLTLDALMEGLRLAAPFPTLFNQYRSVSREHDRADGAVRRLNNLRVYLTHYLKAPPMIVVVGEAAGYRGNRFTGLPFTSEYHCAEHPFLRELKLRPSSSRGTPWREASASIVWETFDAMEQRPLLWSSVPFHPHKEGEPLSNRAPLRAEIEQGAELFKLFRRLFPKARLAATGRVAQAMLKELGESCEALRHPSHGGKQEFQNGLWAMERDAG